MAELEILLPNGQVLAAQVYIKDAILGPIPWDGVISVGPIDSITSITDPVTVIQPVGASLHVVVDSAPASTVTNDGTFALETGGNLDTIAAKNYLTDAQLRASAVPISAASLPLPTGAALEAGNLATILTRLTSILSQLDVALSTRNAEATQLLVKAKTDNIDVLLSTRTKPADQQHAILDSGVVTSITNPIAVTNSSLDGTLLATVDADIKQISTDVKANIVLHAGTNLIGKVGIDQTTPGTTNAVQANAGTNLNTSLLALEAGGNLAAIKTDTDKIPSQGAALTASSTPVNIASDQIVPVSPSVATAAAPTYVEGTKNPLSTDLTGAIRITGSISASSAATATASNPSYTEGSSVAFSQDLAGNLRVKASALVGDSRESYNSGDIQPLSMTTDGRLRVATSPSDSIIDFFGDLNPFRDANIFGITASEELYGSDINPYPF